MHDVTMHDAASRADPTCGDKVLPTAGLTIAQGIGVARVYFPVTIL